MAIEVALKNALQQELNSSSSSRRKPRVRGLQHKLSLRSKVLSSSMKVAKKKIHEEVARLSAGSSLRNTQGAESRSADTDEDNAAALYRNNMELLAQYSPDADKLSFNTGGFYSLHALPSDKFHNTSIKEVESLPVTSTGETLEQAQLISNNYASSASSRHTGIGGSSTKTEEQTLHESRASRQLNSNRGKHHHDTRKKGGKKQREHQSTTKYTGNLTLDGDIAKLLLAGALGEAYSPSPSVKEKPTTVRAINDAGVKTAEDRFEERLRRKLSEDHRCTPLKSERKGRKSRDTALREQSNISTNKLFDEAIETINYSPIAKKGSVGMSDETEDQSDIHNQEMSISTNKLYDEAISEVNYSPRARKGSVGMPDEAEDQAEIRAELKGSFRKLPNDRNQSTFASRLDKYEQRLMRKLSGNSPAETWKKNSNQSLPGEELMNETPKIREGEVMESTENESHNDSQLDKYEQQLMRKLSGYSTESSVRSPERGVQRKAINHSEPSSQHTQESSEQFPKLVLPSRRAEGLQRETSKNAVSWASDTPEGSCNGNIRTDNMHRSMSRRTVSRRALLDKKLESLRSSTTKPKQETVIQLQDYPSFRRISDLTRDTLDESDPNLLERRMARRRSVSEPPDDRRTLSSNDDNHPGRVRHTPRRRSSSTSGMDAAPEKAGSNRPGRQRQTSKPVNRRRSVSAGDVDDVPEEARSNHRQTRPLNRRRSSSEGRPLPIHHSQMDRASIVSWAELEAELEQAQFMSMSLANSDAMKIQSELEHSLDAGIDVDTWLDPMSTGAGMGPSVARRRPRGQQEEQDEISSTGELYSTDADELCVILDGSGKTRLDILNALNEANGDKGRALSILL